jgi:7-carboxy-7-deazaguanine synthase
MSLDDILAEVDRHDCDTVEVTGGEPLLQKEVYSLMQYLLDRGKTVLLETGGHISLAQVPPAVHTIMDVKCPGSGEAHTTDWGNLDRLDANDEVKFVIRDRADYEYACGVLRLHALQEKVAAVLFSPVHGVLEPRTLSEWVLADRLPVRVQLQVHKYIWSPETRGV